MEAPDAISRSKSLFALIHASTTRRALDAGATQIDPRIFLGELLPHQRRGFGDASNYMTRRRWDYFVKHLLNMEPPKEYELKPPAPAGRGGR